MPEERPLHEVLIELAVYVPIGLVASVAEQLPELTAKGRKLASTRIQLARMMGEFAVGHAQRRFGHVISSRGRPSPGSGESFATPSGHPNRHDPETIADERRGATTTPARSPSASTRPVRTNRLTQAPVTAAIVPEPVSQPARPRRPPPAATTKGPTATTESPDAETSPDVVSVVESLAIPAYDTLAASQVVQRLSSLEPAELEAVRRYEAATRGRRTILHRVAQLSSTDGLSPT